MSANDMVLDSNLNPAWCDSPEGTKRWLEYRLAQDQRIRSYSVRVGKTMQIVSISAYLRRNP